MQIAKIMSGVTILPSMALRYNIWHFPADNLYEAQECVPFWIKAMSGSIAVETSWLACLGSGDVARLKKICGDISRIHSWVASTSLFEYIGLHRDSNHDTMQ